MYAEHHTALISYGLISLLVCHLRGLSRPFQTLFSCTLIRFCKISLSSLKPQQIANICRLRIWSAVHWRDLPFWNLQRLHLAEVAARSESLDCRRYYSGHEAIKPPRAEIGLILRIVRPAKSRLREAIRSLATTTSHSHSTVPASTLVTDLWQARFARHPRQQKRLAGRL